MTTRCAKIPPQTITAPHRRASPRKAPPQTSPARRATRRAARTPRGRTREGNCARRRASRRRRPSAPRPRERRRGGALCCPRSRARARAFTQRRCRDRSRLFVGPRVVCRLLLAFFAEFGLVRHPFGSITMGWWQGSHLRHPFDRCDGLGGPAAGRTGSQPLQPNEWSDEFATHSATSKRCKLITLHGARTPLLSFFALLPHLACNKHTRIHWTDG